MNLEIIVLDGFGIGAMPDAGEVRVSDVDANTALALATWCSSVRGRPLQIPNLARLGLVQLDPELSELLTVEASNDPDVDSVYHRVALGYPGADTFAGHQTMMGADMSNTRVARVGEYIDELTRTLTEAGHRVELMDGDKPLVVVDGDILVHDNLEADPGLNWNVSGRLSEHSFDQILDVANTVRGIAPVARVIAVGGYSDQPLPSYVRPGADNTIGLDTPASGFYKNGGLQVIHEGVEIEHARQLPELATSNGVNVSLVGKAADILVTDHEVRRLPGVETSEILDNAKRCLDQGRTSQPSLTVVNVQQTDLAGHQQDVARYVEIIEQFDAWLGGVLAELRDDDVLIITADHGNDPLIGHAFHTREFVPCIVAIRGEQGRGIVARPGQDLDSLADIGASCARMLGIAEGSIGHGISRDLFE